jgi:DNA-binding IclR family transcriptional regulator
MPQRVAAADPASTALKAVAVIEFLTGVREGLGLNEIARRLGSSRGSALRILAALARKGLVTQDSGNHHYRLTLRLLELGNQVLEQIEIQTIAKPHLERLSQLSGETAHLGVLDGWDIIFVGKAEPANPIRLHSRIGYRVPSHCTALGKALLASLPPEQLQHYIAVHPLTPMTPRTITSPQRLVAHLAHVRAQGYAVDAEDHRPGICCVGAPIYAHRGQTVAAVSISGPAFRMTAKRIPSLVKLVKDAADAISRELGHPVDERRIGRDGVDKMTRPQPLAP